MMDLPQPKKNREYAVIFLSYYYIALIIKYYITVKTTEIEDFQDITKQVAKENFVKRSSIYLFPNSLLNSGNT